MTEARIKVLYIAGSGRSGSTLLHNMLGQVDGFDGFGELYQIWSRGFEHNMLCGCKTLFRDCPTWKAILTRAYGGYDGIDVDRMRRLSRSFRFARVHRMLVPSLRRKTLQQLAPYLESVERLYQAIASTTGARVIVDSSKTPGYAYLLNQIPSIDLCIVQIIRDPRATSHSWTRKKLFQPEGAAPIPMARRHPAKSAIQWIMRNALTEMYVRPGASRSMQLRYEALIERPKESLQAILDMLEEPASLDFVNGKTVEIDKDNHSVFGNLVRFRSGAVALEADERWKRDMASRHKLAVTALTLPLLYRYGYRATS
ncbi:MAG: sulfotransferase [Planctomycetota bacterium]